jgi:Nucleopolyhedrovirus telokin-like protein-20 (TLP20)
MATSNSNTVDISVHVTLDKEANKNILSFIVREEYHLKKLAVGAYSLNILDTQLLNDLAQRSCTITACGDYVIVYNFKENSNKINVILFNIRPSVLKKGGCIFKITYSDALPQQTPSPTPTGRTSDKILDETVATVDAQHANNRLFQSTFARQSSSSSSSSNDDADDDDNASQQSMDSLSEPVPAKRQKLGESDKSEV